MSILRPEEAHIWFARQPPALAANLVTTLSRDERDRASRFRFASNRFAFEFAHAVLRDVLRRYLGCSSRDIRFRQSSFGKPSLAGPESSRGIEFNLAHAGRLVLIGVCRGRRIGVDVEEVQPLDDLASIAESHFTAQERAFILSQNAEDQTRAFFRCWTRKEACIKAVGKGLSIPLNSFDTFISHGQRDRFLEIKDDPPDSVIWQLTDLDLRENCSGAVAIERGVDRLVYFEWKAVPNEQENVQQNSQ